MIGFALRLTPGRRPGGDRPAGRHRRRRRARRRPAARRRGRAQRGRREEPARRLAQLRHRGRRPVRYRHRRAAVVGGARGLLRRPRRRPGRPRRHRAGLPGAARHPPAARPGRVLRVTRAGRAAAHDAPRRARPPVPRPPGRGHRPGRAARAELAGHHHRRYPRTGRAPARRQADRPPDDHLAEPVRRLRGRVRRRGHRPDPVRGGRRAALPGTDLHRYRQPARRRPPGTAVRRDAPGRCHASAGHHDRDGGVDRGRRRRYRHRVRPVLRVAPLAGGDTVHRRAVLPGRPVAHRGRHPGGRSGSCSSWSGWCSRVRG